MVLRALHLCSGYGGFELALRGHARTVAHVERDAYAAATLVARMAEARLDQAPIWSDLTTFDAAPWRGAVDLVTAGFPCQPFSAAGKRLGTDDDRWLWPEIARIIRDVAPAYVMLENVPGVIRAGLTHVLSDLAEYGFDAEWGLYAASDVGAPHRRQRFWLVGNAAGCKPPALLGSRYGRSNTDGASRRPRWLADVADAARFGGYPPRADDLGGWAAWNGPQPGICRGTDGSTDWLADALHLGGNGLVPQCARAAWEQLSSRLGDN